MKDLKLKTAVICGGHLGAEFLKALRRHHHDVFAVSSPDPRIQALCQDLGITCEPDQQVFFETLARTAFDCLFSIINPRLTPDWVLKLPRLGAFNYHDSLLPRRRGVNAVAWALWEGDPAVGFSWHRMQPTVDSGDLLYQETLPLKGDETTFAANLKVFTRAVRTFDIVIERFAAYACGYLALTPQDPNVTPTLHRKADAPSAADRTFEPGRQTSGNALRKARALDFGPGTALFGSLLFAVKHELVPCRLKAPSAGAPREGLDPGEIRYLSPGRYLVCCADGQVLEATTP